MSYNTSAETFVATKLKENSLQNKYLPEDETLESHYKNLLPSFTSSIIQRLFDINNNEPPLKALYSCRERLVYFLTYNDLLCTPRPEMVPGMPRPISPFALQSADVLTLQGWLRMSTLEQSLAQRARILLLLNEGV